MTPDTDHLLELGDRLRERRRALDLSVRQLAERADVSPSYVSAIETGKNPSTGRPTVPSKRVMESLHRALGLKLSEPTGTGDAAGPCIHSHDHTLVYFLGTPRTSPLTLLTEFYEREVDHWVYIADPRNHPPEGENRHSESKNVTRIVWPFGSEVYPDEFLVPDRIHAGLSRELAQAQEPIARERVGLMIEDCSAVMRWMVNPETEVENETVWTERVCHSFLSTLGIPPSVNVCVYKHADMEPIANRIDILSTLLSLMQSHNLLICVDTDGTIEVGESAAARVLAQVRPSGVSLDAWNTIARASAKSLTSNHHVGGTYAT